MLQFADGRSAALPLGLDDFDEDANAEKVVKGDSESSGVMERTGVLKDDVTVVPHRERQLQLSDVAADGNVVEEYGVVVGELLEYFAVGGRDRIKLGLGCVREQSGPLGRERFVVGKARGFEQWDEVLSSTSRASRVRSARIRFASSARFSARLHRRNRTQSP